MCFKPGNCVIRGKSVERRNELPLAARITGREHPRIEQSVRYIATPAAGNAHLGKKFRAALEKRNLAVSIGTRRSDRSKKTSRTATHDHDFSHSLTYSNR